MADRAQYMRVYRRVKSTDQLSRLARDRAQRKLLDEHTDEYRRLVDKEREELGLPPARKGPRGG